MIAGQKPEISLRLATQDDHSFIKELTRSAMRPYVEKTWADEAEREDYYQRNSYYEKNTDIIEYQGQKIGRCSVEDKGESLYIDNLHLMPDFRGKGIGHLIINGVLHKASARKIPVTLTVLRVNPAVTLYKRLGFFTMKEDNFRYHMIYNS